MTNHPVEIPLTTAIPPSIQTSLSFWFVHRFVKETKGRTLEEA